MKYPRKWTAALLCAAMLLGALSACGTGSGGLQSESAAPTQTPAASLTPETDASQAGGLDLTDATAITLSGGGATVAGEGAEAEGGVVTITAAGVYAVSGSLSDGRVIVNAPGEDVTVALNGAEITCSYGSPLYIYQAGTATVHLVEGTENALTDGADYTYDDNYSSAEDEEPNACLYSKAELVIQGKGSLAVTANCSNGITGKDALQICGGVLSVTAVNKGIKAGTALTLTGGVYTLDCTDDAIHSKGDVTVVGGAYTISAGDDALHADGALAVSGGEIDILTSNEGLEGTTVTVSGGTVRVVSSDDGVNAADGSDSTSTVGTNSNCYIDISGGCLVVQAGGDGLDSNGNAAMSGGTVIVSSTGREDGALDYDGTFTISGGTLLAVGIGNMAQAPSESEQCTVFLGFDSTLAVGTYVSLAGESGDFVFQLPVEAGNLVFSSPELERGGTYTVSYGGTYSGQAVDGICSGGDYSGGTVLTELTLSNDITTYGNRGMGPMGGGPGGDPGDAPQGDRGEPPADGGTPPEGGTPPDGEAPAPDGMPEDWPTRESGMPEPGDRREPPDGASPPPADSQV